jgi:adenylosuccinate lyase
LNVNDYFYYECFLIRVKHFSFDKHKKNIYTGERMAHFDELSALSPLDGRYFIQTQSLRKYFSEFALIKYRTNVELQYLSFLSRKKIIRTIKPKEKILIKNIVDKFSIEDAVQVKVFEQETKHDVKSLEYFLKEKLESTTLRDILPFVHFGLTSEDVNAIAYALMIRDAHKAVVTVILSDLLSVIRILTRTNAGSFMLAKTHGQAAVPTTFGK